MAEGYKAVTPIQIANIVSAYNSDVITFRAVRVFWGCLELIAIREAAKRSTGKSRGVRYRPEELLRLTGLTLTIIKRELRALRRAELLTFSESAITITETPLSYAREMLETLSETRKATRLIPIPRNLICFICKANKPALVSTLLGYALRGLTLKKGELKTNGSVKAAWIAETLSLSLRSVRASRRELISLGILSEDNSTQHKLNRCGAYFEINTSWKQGRGVIHRKTQSEPSTAPAAGLTVDNSVGERGENAHKKPTFAPLEAKNSPTFAPPYKDLKTSYRTKNQKLETQPSGFCKKVNLKNITSEDLTRTSLVLILYEQAVTANWLIASEQNCLRFVAAAIRAKRVGLDPVRVFVAIVRQGLWHHITQREEDQARTALRKYELTKRAKQQNSFDGQFSELLRKAVS